MDICLAILPAPGLGRYQKSKCDSQDPLKNKLSEILNEQRVLQQRKEELERMVRDKQNNSFPFFFFLTIY